MNKKELVIGIFMVGFSAILLSIKDGTPETIGLMIALGTSGFAAGIGILLHGLFRSS